MNIKTQEEIKFPGKTVLIVGDDIKAAEAGCDEYITKPVNKKELFELIDKYLK